MKKRQLVLAAAAASALTALAAVAGFADAQTAAVPQNTVAPTIVGAARDGETLTGEQGRWLGDEAFSFAYQWRRCNADGLTCTDIAGATKPLYTVATIDVNSRLRVRVTASSQSGSTVAQSAATAAVTQPTGAVRLADGRFSIPATSVNLPDRLVISALQFTPNLLRSRQPFTGRFRVADTRGYVVRDAIVLVTGVPLGWILAAQEAPTGQDGWARIQLQPTTRLPLVRGGSMVMFLRARKEGDDVLAGISTRRLVRVRTAAPGT
jgi:hypothetical protein